MGQMDRAQIEAMLSEGLSGQMNVDSDEIASYLASMSDEELNEIFSQILTEQIKAAYAEQVAAQMSQMTEEQLVASLEMAMPTYTTEACATYLDLEYPAAINIYASSFEEKDIITAAIADYNKTVDELKQIKYTDYIGIMMSSITTIINAITYVLIAFVSISLVVSSIMIGVITLISVQERTKEIGILRAIGASKKNVSSLFIAENVIIGFSSGMLGVIVTFLLCIPINAILHAITGIGNLDAILPIGGAAALVIISMVLSLVSGFIPSRSAAKKDPVVALRTE